MQLLSLPKQVMALKSTKPIVVIDDNAKELERICSALEPHYTVTGFTNSVDAFASLIQTTPSLIICDVKMPLMSGFELLEHVHKESKLARVPFLFLTSLARLEDFRAGMNLGADDYLTKPFVTDDLIQAVTRRLARKQELSMETPVSPPKTTPLVSITS